MNNLLERFIKRNNKKRGINITVATIVMFLLSCTGIYAATIIDKNEKDNILHVGIDKNGKNAYELGGSVNAIDGDKLIINGRLEAGNNTQSLEISSNAKDVTVENNGFIDGVTIGRDYDSIKTNATFINNGIITNEGNALVIYSNKANVSNYGIIKAGQNESNQTYNGVVLANGATTKNFNNYGIVIDGDGKISSVGASNQQVTMDNGITYTVKNAVNNSGDMAQAQAIEMNGTDGNKAFVKYILNGLETTIEVTSKGNTISNSVVNSLDKAINIKSGAELGLGSTTVNGNIAINGGTLTLTDANNKINGNVSGTTNNDTIKLGYQVDSNTNYTNLNTILKGSGVDALKFSDNENIVNVTEIKKSEFNGKYIGGSGADTFIVDGANYTINGGDGEDTLSLSTAYNSNLSNFKNISNIETLQLANTTNEITIDSNPASFTTIKGGATGSNMFVTTQNITTENLILVSGASSTLYLNNTNNGIEFKGKLEGGDWTIQVNNLSNDKKIALGNLDNQAKTLKVQTAVSGKDETNNLVNLLNSSGITYAALVNGGSQNNNLLFKNTTLNSKSTFSINQYDSVTMQGKISGQYAFRPLGTFTPTVNLSSETTFAEGSKVTSVDYNGKESGVNFKVTEGALNLGKLTYKEDKLVYEGTNPFVDGYKYIINGNVQLGFEGLTDLKSGQELTLDKRNDNIKVNGSITIPSFLKYQDGAFVVKTWSEMNPYGNNNNFLETTYNNMLSDYGKNEAIKGALDKWSKDALVSYITNGGITQYDFSLDGKTYQNTLLTGDNSDISKEFKITGSSGSITFQNIATSDSLTLDTTDGTINLTDGVSIGGDINFGDSSNVNLNVNAYYAGGVASTIKNIKGNDNDSNISLTHVNIIGNNSNDGKIDLGAGTDTLTLNNVGVNSITGSGKNTIELNQGSNVGTISLSKDKAAKISLMALDVDSSIDNNITVNDGATVGTIDLSSAGNSLVTLNSGKITNVKFGSGNDMLTYNGGNISSVDFGAGDNVLNVRADLDLSNTKISVAEGGTVRNTLNVGKLSSRSTTTNDSVTIGGDFSAFNEVNIQGTTKLNSNLILAKDTSVNFNGNTVIAGLNTANGVTTTVLDGTKVVGNSGVLKLDTSSIGLNTNISLSGIDGIDTIAQIESSFAGYNLTKDSNGNYVVEINKDLVSGEDSDVIQAILGADRLANELNGMSYEEQTKILRALEEDTKYSVPYAYSNIVSRKTAEMVNNAVMNLDLKADKNQWLAYGSILGSGKEIKDYYTGATGVGSNIDTDIQGAYVQAEYGYTDNTALGFVVAGNKTDSDIGKSSLKGNGAYLGAYVKHNYSENLQIIGGIAYQNNSYESDRVAGNSSKSYTYSKDYSDNTITGFIGGKYEYKLSDSLVLEPNTRLNITHVSQDSISENKNETLNIETNKKSFTTVSGETGVDLVKKITTEKGTVKLKAGTSLGYLLSGADGKKVTATMGDTAFNIATPDQDKTNVKFKVGAQYEKESGVLYNVEGSYITSSKEKEWVVGAGIGYRF